MLCQACTCSESGKGIGGWKTTPSCSELLHGCVHIYMVDELALLCDGGAGHLLGQLF